jgi:hypothetical protein
MTPIIPEIYDERGKRIWNGAKARRAYLADKSCQLCGSTDRLQFHHRDPTDRTTDVRFSLSDERLVAEIAKCDLLCKECHAKQHVMRHGTNSMYTAGKCRCELCSANWRTYNREYKRRYRQNQRLK